MGSLRAGRSAIHRQRGVVFIVMMIVMVLGTAAFLVGSLNSASLQIAREQATADVLGRAKEALIAYAASDSNRPGELPCPDFNNDGEIKLADDYSGSNCKSLVGWLPWKTLGLPELRDANGDHLWYALAAPFHAGGSATLNSDTPASYPTSMLTIKDGATGTTLESNVVAIVFSPGPIVSGQMRSPADNNAVSEAQNYLEGDNANADTVFQTANDRVVPAPTPLVNDRLLAIGRDSLFPIVEKRIAREVKSCLDNYAADASNTNHRYPWAAPVSDTTAFPNRTGAYDVLFGRVPEITNTSTGGTTPTGTLLTLIQAVQIALNAYLSNPTSATLSLLRLQGDVLKDYTGATPAARAAGITADGCTGLSCTATLQDQLDTAMGGDGTMPATWTTPACISLFTSPSSYWAYWRDLVFYQVAAGYQPGGGAFVPLHIAGSGNPIIDTNTYRAAVLVAGRMLPPLQARPSTANPPVDYLEASGATSNAHQSAAGAAPSTDFVTYRPSDMANYPTVNDLVLCLDGKVNCK